MKKWQIEALFYPDGWKVPNDQDFELFDTREEAVKELKAHIASMEKAVEMGYLTDCNAHDWRVAEVEVQE